MRMSYRIFEFFCKVLICMITSIIMVEERFDSKKNQLWLEKLFDEIVSYALPLVRDKYILDAGSGSGWSESKFVDAGAKKIDAFDIDEESVKFGNSLKLEGVTYAKKDFNESDFGDNIYDTVISVEVIEHLTNAEYYFKNLVRALKPNGILFLTTPNKKLSTNQNQYHVKEYTLEEMSDMFKKNNVEITELHGISSSSGSKIAGKFIPRPILEIVKKTFLYSILVKHFVRFPIKPNVEDAETIVYIGKKVQLN
mgnify:CR=1 FL=1